MRDLSDTALDGSGVVEPMQRIVCADTLHGDAMAVLATNAAGNIKATREDWLNAAIGLLVSGGIENVRILTLSQRLNVSRSSFYWYFRSHQELLDHLLDFWLEKNTGSIIERAQRPAGGIVKAVMNISECWLDSDLFDTQLDFAVREWARRSDKVRAVVDRADTERLNAFTAVFRKFGYDRDEAAIRARVLYYSQIGYFTLVRDEAPEPRKSRFRGYIRCYTGIEPTDQEIEQFQEFYATIMGRRQESRTAQNTPGLE